MSRVAPLLPEDPRRLGAYRLTGRLGAGGQGIVFLAEPADGPLVAIKLLHARLLDEERVRRRFMGEVEAVRRVAPFCTARVLDADLDGDHPYIVSEYVDGVSLQEHIAAEGPRSDGSLDRIAVGTATALAAIHRAGVVHRDFKPGNVLLGMDGPRVIDFGISRMMDTATTTGKIPFGTPAYMSPEQIKGESAGPPADMFSWALTVAFAATGRHAFSADSYHAVLARILYGTPDLGPLTGPLREIVVACLAADPQERPGAEEVLGRLYGHGDRATVSRPVPVRAGENGGRTATAEMPPVCASTAEMLAVRASTAEMPPVEPAEELPTLASVPRRRRRWWWWAAAAAGIVAAAAAVWGFLSSSAGPSQDDGFSLAGIWTGVADHASAERVFPVEIRLAEGETAVLRWGADLHCAGRLTPDGDVPPPAGASVYRLDRVTGEGCHPGTLVLSPRGENQVAFEVVRKGEKKARYSGRAVRSR
ncbi:serine/threonine-protein kinase [Planobispora rosea]|uniref:serine/threonine-protein kinase n=1 Tax=Planobispora rosea TaxID=35762 RepID=UPI000A0518E5|nr:serine/threonine-protein kinase [Planobispora rosea]